MRNYLKSLAVLTVILITLSMTLITAGAAGSTPQTDALNHMGLFLGTGNGYELEKVPTRTEAVVMLVRLLGKEPEVKAGTYRHPFTDVPAWADKYLGYLYQNGLVKGTSPTTFTPQMNCNAQMFTVLILRALGYTENNGSFTYDNAVGFAENLGIIDPSIDAGTFRRNELASLSYSALFQRQKDSSVILLDKLIASGAVSQSSADGVLSAYNTFKDYAAACTASYLDISTQRGQEFNTEISIAGQTRRISQGSDVKTVVNGDKLIMQEIDFMSDGTGNTEDVYYYKDGWLYIQTETGGWEKTRTDINKSDYIAEINISANPFYLMDSMTKAASGTETTYTIHYAPSAFSTLLGIEPSELADVLEVSSLNISSVKEVTVFGSDGKLKSQNITCQINARMTSDGETYPVSILMTYLTRVWNTGDAVTIPTPSNLDKAVEITG